MAQDGWKGRLEIVTNVAVLLVAVVVLATFARMFFSERLGPRPETGIHKGQTFVRVPGVDFNVSPQTLFIAMNTRCHYCTESLPFYRKLAEAHRADGKATHLIAAFPDAEGEVKQYMQKNNLDLDTVSGVDFTTLNIIGTPTAILVDSSGRILDFWVGKLPQEMEQQVIKAVSKPRG